MADGLCSDGKTVASLINENPVNSGENFEICEKSISADCAECPNIKFQQSETQKSGVNRDHNMTGANQLQHNVDPELSDVGKISGDSKKNNNALSGNTNVKNDRKNVSSGASVVQRKKNKFVASNGQGLHPDVDLNKSPSVENGQETDDSRAKKKRCSDRYDSSESSDSGVATLSCTDSSTHSSDASDPGSPYSPVSLGDDVHQLSKANMPPQTVLATQPHQQPPQQHKSAQHQWPWNAINNPLNNNNNNNFSASNKNSVNSVPSSNKHKRLSTNSSDTNGTAKKVRPANNCADKNQSGVPSAVKRLKATCVDESQTKITGYFKSQMKPLNALKKDFSNLVTRSTEQTAGLDKYFNILSKVKDDKGSKANGVQKMEVDVRTLTTMPPSLKKIERKMTKVAQVAPVSRKNPNSQVKSPKKHVAIAPRTSDVKKTTATTNALRKTSATSIQVDQSKISQPTVLLTAIRIPNQQQQMTSTQQQAHQSSKVSSTSAKVGSVFQIPMMPNLVQIPNILTTSNGANLVVNNGQLARVGNGAQYFLNGTVIKLQQISAGNGHSGSANSSNGVLTVESGNILVKPPTIAQGVPLTTAAGTKTTLSISQQASIVAQAAVNGNGCPGQAFSTSQRLAAQPVFMTTTTGLLLNAALPTVIATTTAKSAGLPPQAMPALQPIQSASTQSSNILPSLSTILQTHHQTATTSQSMQQPTQFIVSQAETILSNIPQTTLSSIAAKSSSHALPIVTSIATSMISPVPPLVTLASSHDIVSTVTASFERSKQESNSICDDEGIGECEASIESEESQTSTCDDKLSTKSEIKEEKAQSTKLADINSLFDKLKNEPPFLHLEKIKEEVKPTLKEEFKTILLKEELMLCLPSPKSIVLEQIKQKTPPDVFSDEGIKTESSSSNSVETESTPFDELKSTSIDTDIEETDLPKCAVSPILSQPKTIRFPALSGETGFRFGPKGTKRHDGVCYWDNCSEKYDTSSKLLDHLQTQHVNTQSGPFACLWSGCKVHGRESCSRRWLERHVLSHGGTKPFKCIVDGCGLRFGSQLALQKHVNGHFNATESKDNPSKRTSDPPVPKLLRKNGKKLRYRRQPFSARMFDFFDSGVMEGLQHRLMVTGSLANGPKGSITFQGQVMARRTVSEGVSQVFVRWNPSEILRDEWVPETEVTLTKTVAIHSLQIHERLAFQKRLRNANLQSDISTIFNQTSSITASTTALLRTSERKQSRKPPKRIQPS